MIDFLGLFRRKQEGTAKQCFEARRSRLFKPLNSESTEQAPDRLQRSCRFELGRGRNFGASLNKTEDFSK
jgi:hypothetical protein